MGRIGYLFEKVYESYGQEEGFYIFMGEDVEEESYEFEEVKSFLLIP